MLGAAAMSFALAHGACGGDLVGGPGSGFDGGTLTGGTAGGPGNPQCQVPACVTSFQSSVSSCAPMGTCVEQVNATGGDICWANGAKEHVTTGADATMVHGVVTGPDGSTCFSNDIELRQSGNDTTLVITYQDRFGQFRFKISGNPDGSVTLECAGQSPITFPKSCTTMMSGMMPPAATNCTMGTCP
jgi:hypothetical protein